MPRGLLLLILILLVGGYFFLGGGKVTKEALPSLSLSAVVNPSENGYVVGADGYIYLPEGKEYNVSGAVFVAVNGAKVKEQDVSTVAKGPSRIPLSLAGVPVSSSGVSVGADIRVTVDRKELNLSMETPVTFPPKSSLLLLPSVRIFPVSVERTSEGYDVTLKVVFYNPNGFDISLEKPRLLVGSQNFSLPVNSIPSRDDASTEITLTSETNQLQGEVSATVKWGNVGKDLKQGFTLSLPEISPPSPLYNLGLSFISLSPSGIKIKVTGSAKNPSALPVEVPELIVKVRKDDTIKEVNLSGSFTLGPLEEKNFSKEVNTIPFFAGGMVELVAGNTVVASTPLELISPTVLPVPELNFWLEEVNTGAYVLHLNLKEDTEYNVDVEDFDVVGDYGGADVVNFSPISFSFRGEKEVTVGSYDNPLAIPDGTVFTVSFQYGLKNLGMWNRYKVVLST